MVARISARVGDASTPDTRSRRHTPARVDAWRASRGRHRTTPYCRSRPGLLLARKALYWKRPDRSMQQAARLVAAPRGHVDGSARYTRAENDVVRTASTPCSTMSDSPWSQPGTVAGFVRSLPNDALLDVAAREWRASCAAARHRVRRRSKRVAAGPRGLGGGRHRSLVADAAGRRRARRRGCNSRIVSTCCGRRWTSCPSRQPPSTSSSRTASGTSRGPAVEFRQAVREAARAARPGCALFLFTFSRHTLPDTAQPLDGEPFVFTQFSGQPQCFLTEDQFVERTGRVRLRARPVASAPGTQSAEEGIALHGIRPSDLRGPVPARRG